MNIFKLQNLLKFPLMACIFKPQSRQMRIAKERKQSSCRLEAGLCYQDQLYKTSDNALV